MVHQHFMLIPVMTVAENIVLGVEPNQAGIFLDEAPPGGACAISRRRFNFAIDPDARIQNITVGQQQRVEILKALYRRADILILDEPTAVLTPQEAIDLFEILRTLTREGMSVIFISHKLHEVLEIADRISVLRRGKLVGTVPQAGATEQALAELMVGREVLLQLDKDAGAAGRDAPRSRRTTRSTTTAASRRCATSASRCAPARSSASPASTATGRPSSSRR